MYKCVITYDMASKLIISQKTVGESCALSMCCHVVPNDAPDLLGTLFDEQIKTFHKAIDNGDGTFSKGAMIYGAI